MKTKDTLLVGLMLFALFFGAGNLIYPPFLGMESWIFLLVSHNGLYNYRGRITDRYNRCNCHCQGGAEGMANRECTLFFGFVYDSSLFSNWSFLQFLTWCTLMLLLKWQLNLHLLIW
ncbi:branched-chain amino acid transport system II carrier protein [Anaerobacillus sp. HL2]|nr:branched-chain amino acid transport system II carrier protein [Anaerobacillus sp. HL2]